MVPSVYLTRPDEQLVSVVTHFFRQVNGITEYNLKHAFFRSPPALTYL